MTSGTQSGQERTQKLEGLGTRRKRVEDVRFTQGKGNYVDDFKLPGMLFGDFVRSPYGHARITSINSRLRPIRKSDSKSFGRSNGSWQRTAPGQSFFTIEVAAAGSPM